MTLQNRKNGFWKVPWAARPSDAALKLTGNQSREIHRCYRMHWHCVPGLFKHARLIELIDQTDWSLYERCSMRDVSRAASQTTESDFLLHDAPIRIRGHWASRYSIIDFVCYCCLQYVKLWPYVSLSQQKLRHFPVSCPVLMSVFHCTVPSHSSPKKVPLPLL